MLTRRAALRGGTATVAVIAGAGAVTARGAVDEPLLDLERQWLRQRHYACHEQPGETDDERYPAFEALDGIEDQIEETPACSHAEVAVKLRMYARIEGFEPPKSWAHPNAGDYPALSDQDSLAPLKA